MNRSNIIETEQVVFLYLRIYVHTFAYMLVTTIKENSPGNWKRAKKGLWEGLEGGGNEVIIL